jgi:pyrroline-5-carboxylate reductase
MKARPWCGLAARYSGSAIIHEFQKQTQSFILNRGNMQKIAFIGGGNMAGALIAGLVGRVCSGDQIHVVDLNAAALTSLATQYGVGTASSIDARVGQAEVVVLAVKPQNMLEVATQLATVLQPQQLVMSIAAGIRLADLARWLAHANVVRTMPNTPALIGQGITGMVALAGVSPAQRESAQAIMQAVGQTLWLDDDSQIDAVTALSGSGPAYVFYFLEAMQKAGQELGLSAPQALQLAQQTFAGATQLAQQSTEPLSLLRERVTSKGGTTYAALTSMAQAKVAESIINAIKAAAARGKAMGEEFGAQA